MAFLRWHRAVLGLALLAMGAAACSVLFDLNKDQCSTSADCGALGKYCREGVCTAFGPEGCVPGTPRTPDDFANQCSSADCERVDNCEQAALCNAGDKLPDPIEPTRIVVDAGVMPDASPIDAPPPPTPVPCIEGDTVVVTGSTAVQPMLTTVAPLLAPFRLAYQPSGSCAGVENIFNPDPERRKAKDIANRQALRFESDGSSRPCTFPTEGVPVDVGVSDVYASSCRANYLPSSLIGDYPGPIQPMTFVVHAESTQNAISAEKAHIVFGLGSMHPKSAPYSEPALYFIRNSGSGTQQMLARAIDVDAAKWWGSDRGGSTSVRDDLKRIDRARANSGIGILSTDFADDARGALKVLAFQARNQLCGYYPDSSPNILDKANVRDGHYSIWGPVHFYTELNDGRLKPGAAILLDRFTVSPTPTDLLAAIARSGLVPQCAMTVTRNSEMGPLMPYAPPVACSCFFEASVKGGAVPARCRACTVSNECPAETPACNYGYCELAAR